MILPPNKLLRSFTLIELLMVVSIITIVSGITIPSFSSYMTNQGLKNAQDQFKSDLRSVENMALTGSKYETTITCGATTCPAMYWVVRWVGGGTSSAYETYLMYDFGAAFDATCTNLSNVATKQASYNLPGGVTFKGQSGCSECLFFNMANGGTHYTIVGSSCTGNNAQSTKIILQNVNGASSPVGWNLNGTLGN